MRSAQQIIDIMMTKLQAAVGFTKEQPVVLLLNNLGGVSQLELNIIKKEAIQWCRNHGVAIARILCGSYMTSLNGHGFSVTVLRVVESDIIDHLDAPTKPSAVPFTEEEASLAKKCVQAVCNKMTSMESELNALDGVAGDGDCGSTFAHASKVISERMKTLEVNSAEPLLHILSEIFEQEVGGTGGALYALMLSAAAGEFAGSPIGFKHFSTALIKATDVVQKYGGAKPGDRTLVDSLCAAIEKIRGGETNWDIILEAAMKAAHSTAQMKAAAGRASYTSKEVQTRPDAGAMAIAYFMLTIWETIKHNKA
ncbi:hypothetical protein KIN20_032121 [Parelaphostrongylus tenuis]|uniref:Triokinase/FMN cyclase n=1 Tax=Parelaphostrongylus tenuis TaxID=148309 RepID=A0AAD5R650_PARTN|nr:hypothetical protein KIN20_032121 [Parelaphostrongylus tenuis]